MGAVTATICSAGTSVGSAYEVLAIDVRREVNRIPRASLVLLDGDAARRRFAASDAGHFEPGTKIEIKLRHEAQGEDATVFEGAVVRQGVEADARGSLLRIEMKDAAVKLTQGRKSRVFRDKSDAQAIGEVLDAAKVTKGTVDDTDPQHGQIVQYRCSDWDFIVSRADANGLLVLADGGTVSARKVKIDTNAQHKFDYGISEIYELEFALDAGCQPPQVQSRGWSIKEQKATDPVEAKAFALEQGNLDGAQLAQSLGFGPWSLTHPAPLVPKELEAWADARLMRSRMSMIRGRLSTRGLAGIGLLETMQIDGVGRRFNGKTLITGICHRVDADGWRTDVQFGLSPRAFSQEEDIAEEPAAGLLPGVGGLQLAVVEKFEDDPDKELRVKIALAGVDPAAEALWARLAAPQAGNGRGLYFRPEEGDEVVVGFCNQDPRQPVVLGALYSSKNKAPQALAPPDEKNLKKGIVTKAGTKIVFDDGDKKAKLYLETPSKNKVLLDDGEKLIEISDQHGNRVRMNKDGIELHSAKDLKLSAAAGKVQIQGKEVDVK